MCSGSISIQVIFFSFTQNIMSLVSLYTQIFLITRKQFSIMSLIYLSFSCPCSYHAYQAESCFLSSMSTIFSPTVFISSFSSILQKNISSVISRVLTYFSIGLVLLFTHSNVYFHAIVFNMKQYIFGVVNILIYASYLSLLFTSLMSLYPILLSLCDYLPLFPGSHVFLHLSKGITEFPKNVFWFPCRRPFSEECSSSGFLLCNGFSCFQ